MGAGPGDANGWMAPSADDGYGAARIVSHDPDAVAVGVDAQWADVEAVLAGDAARLAAVAALRRRGAFGVRPEELVSEAWLRLSTTFARRTKPYPEWDATSAQRLVARAIDAALVDVLRRLRPTEMVPVGDPPVAGVLGQKSRLESIDALRSVVAEIRRRAADLPCGGCSPDVVLAAAVAMVQHVAAEAQPGGRGRDFERLLTAALTEVLGPLSPAAMRQRRRRCGPCVRRLIEEAMGAAGLGEA